jgi:hypothetical protein
MGGPAALIRLTVITRSLAMDQTIAQPAPTSNATTKDTEPEVVAAISSGEGGPDLPTAIRIGGPAFGAGRALMLLAAGMALGCGAAYWLRAEACNRRSLSS